MILFSESLLAGSFEDVFCSEDFLKKYLGFFRRFPISFFRFFSTDAQLLSCTPHLQIQVHSLPVLQNENNTISNNSNDRKFKVNNFFLKNHDTHDVPN